MGTDVNVTDAIAANVTLMQPWWVPWIPAIVGFIGAVIGGLVVGSSNYYLQKIKIRSNQIEKQKQILGELSGNRILLMQLFDLHANAFIRYIVHRQRSISESIRWNKELYEPIDVSDKSLVNSVDYKLMKTEEEKIERYELLLAQGQEKLYDIVGRIRVSFDDISKLDRLISDIDKTLKKYNSILEDPSMNLDANLVFPWKVDMIQNVIPNYIENELYNVINNLLIYLENEIHMNQKKKN